MLRRLAKSIGWIAAAAVGLGITLALIVWIAFIPSRKEPPYTLTATWGGPGNAPGQLNDPNGIAVRGNRVYVADSRNHRVQIFDRQGNYQGQIAVGTDGLKPSARPMNLNIAGGKLYVADYWNDVVQVYSLDGGAPTLIETLGSKASSPKGAHFRSPGGASALPNGDIVVADFYNQRVQILTPQGQLIHQIGKTGHKAYISGGGFNYPTDVAVNSSNGTIYVADGYNDRIQEFTPEGRFIRKWGGPFGMNIKGSFNGWFRTVTSVAVGPQGNVFAVDEENYRVQKFTPQGRFLTAFGTPSKGAGYTEEAVAVAADGTVYTTNLSTNQVQVWKPARSR